jgi:nitroreductase
MDTLEALKWRYAVKKFDPEKILPGEKIELLKKAFRLTPSSSGLQPIKLVIVHDKNLQKTLENHSFGQKQISTASHVLVFCIEADVSAEFIHQKFDREKEIRNTSEKILKPFRENLIARFEKKQIPEKNRWAINQVYLAMGNLLNVCAMEEIDACPMEGFDLEKYDELLDLKSKNLKSVLAMPIGHRAKDDFFADLKKVRRPLEEIIVEIGNR